MSRSNLPTNPFYVVLVMAGFTFGITASAYGFMLLQQIHQESTNEDPPPGLFTFLDEHGMTLLIVELGLLAFSTFATIGTDAFWQKRAERRRTQCQQDGSREEPKSPS